MNDNDSLLADFIAESREHLASIETDLLAIESLGANIDEELVNKVFRAAHSIKGGSGFVGLTRIRELAHSTETALSLVRSRQLVPDGTVVNIFLLAFDRLRDLINNHASSENADINDQVTALNRLCTNVLPESDKGAVGKLAEVSFGKGQHRYLQPATDLLRARNAGFHLLLVRLDLLSDVEAKGRNPLLILRELNTLGEVLHAAVNLDAVGGLEAARDLTIPFEVILATNLDAEPLAIGLSLESSQVIPADAPAAAPPSSIPVAAAAPAPATTVAAAPQAAPAPAPAPAEQPVTTTQKNTPPASSAPATVDNTIRINVEVLEQLMDLVGELVLGRNQLRDAVARHRDDRTLTSASQHIDNVTVELQDAIMRARLQPVGTVFNRFPRLVRDLSQQLGKDVALDIEGRDVELDKTLIEGLGDPLMHMVRNAIDHGLEDASQRAAAGKPTQGRVTLRAFHEAGQVVIEVVDDGKGIDPDRVANSAVKKGLIPAARAAAMSARDKIALIMLAGLSTAEKVTDVSGRGVGMDVVKSNIERLGGTVEIDSVIGRGSRFRITLPLTLAIIPSLIVAVAEERFAIPQASVAELIRVPQAQLNDRIERVGRAETLLLRGSLVPLIRLRSLLKVADGPAGDLRIVILSSGERTFGLVVDELHTTEDVVVKPLGRLMRGHREYAGATIMGDGEVALILDAAGVAGIAGLSGRDEDHQSEDALEAATQSFLLFHATPHETCAVPLDLVLRTERITSDRIETVGGRRVMRYRGASLPIIALHDVAKVGTPPPESELAVIIFTIGNRELGLLGAMPVEVIDTSAEVDRRTLRQTGIAGSLIDKDRTILVADLQELVDAAYPEYAATTTAMAGGTLLLAEDSNFIRAQVKGFLESAGYIVIEACDGEEGWTQLQRHRIDAVVTDIEMPKLDGYGLTKRVRADRRFAHLPVIALTTLSGTAERSAGLAAGITDWQVKLDRDRLITALNVHLHAAVAGNKP